MVVFIRNQARFRTIFWRVAVMSASRAARVFASVDKQQPSLKTKPSNQADANPNVAVEHVHEDMSKMKPSPESDNTITVCATGELSLPPDRCKVLITMSSKKDNVQDVKNSVARRVDYIKQTLHNHHVKVCFSHSAFGCVAKIFECHYVCVRYDKSTRLCYWISRLQSQLSAFHSRGGTRSGFRFIRGVCSSGVQTLTLFKGKPDSENIPCFGEISQSRAPEAVRTPKTYPILGKFDKLTPYFREIWQNHTLF